MIPIYLTFSDEAEALTALMVRAEDEEMAPRWPARALQWVPVPISRATGAMDADGAPVFEAVAGYHVNALWDGSTDIAALDPWRRFPATPSVHWAGLAE